MAGVCTETLNESADASLAPSPKPSAIAAPLITTLIAFIVLLPMHRYFAGLLLLVTGN
jgi:hypothetical protein